MSRTLPVGVCGIVVWQLALRLLGLELEWEATDKCFHDVTIEGMGVEWKPLTNACMMSQLKVWGFMEATQCIMEATDKCMYDVTAEGMEVEWMLLSA